MQNKNNYMTVKGMSLSHVIAVLIDIKKTNITIAYYFFS